MRTHRHFVAVPLTLALLMLVLASHPGAGHGSASAMQVGNTLNEGGVLATQSDATEFSAMPGIRGVLDAKSSLRYTADAVVLQSGTAIVRTSGYLRMQVGDQLTVDGVRTGWYALHDDANAVVVALAAPIAVTVRGELTILTAGEQLRVPAATDQAPQRSSVPQAWLQQNIARVAQLSDAPVDFSEVIGDASPLHVLRDAIIEQHYDAARAFIQDANNQPALSDAANHAAVAAVVAELGQSANADVDAIGVALHCVRLLRDDMPLDRLLSIAYGIGRVPGADAAAESMLADAFPIGDDAARWAELMTVIERSSTLPLPDAFVLRWQNLVERTAATDAAAAGKLIADASLLPLTIEDRGYPRHARVWEAAIRDAVSFVQPLLSDGDHVLLEKALEDSAARALPKAVQPAPGTAAVPVVSTRTPEELIALTKEAITQKGGMLTPTTSFVIPTNQADAVRVIGIYFATRKGDLSFEFTYHPLTSTLDRIVVNGQLLPNTLTLEQFLAGL